MATSGVVEGNKLNSNRMYVYVNWQLAAQEVDNNRSLINFQAYARFISSDSQLDNSRVWMNNGSDNDVSRNTGRVYNYTGNLSNHDVGIGSGSFWVGHGADGAKAFGIGTWIDFYGSGHSEGYGVFDLPTIPRASNPTFGKNPYKIGETITINMNRKSGSFTHNGTIQVPDENAIKSFSGVTDQYNWTPDASEIDALYARMPNTNSTSLATDVNTYNGGSYVGAGWQNITITTDLTVCMPVFTDFDLIDTNAATVAITGNNQVLIQNKSSLSVTVPVAKRMVPQKSSTAINYVASIDGAVDTKNYSSTADVIFPFGVQAGEGSKTISVRAVDSRGNSTTVNKEVTIIPYLIPDLVITATRLNNFEDATTIKVSGIFSRLTIGGVDKNSITASSLKYRIRQDGGAWGSYVTIPFTQSAGAFSGTDQIISLVNSSLFDIEVSVTDKLGTITEMVTLDRGVPIFFISDNKEAIGVNKMPDGTRKGMYLNPTDNLFNMVYPIGSIYMSVNSANPSTLFGGTWVAWSTGRVPVGIDASQSEFNTIEKTGGHKLLQAHTHANRWRINFPKGTFAGFGTNDLGGDATLISDNMPGGDSAAGYDAGGNPTVGLSAGGGDSQNLQPYITCYMWKRTA